MIGVTVAVNFISVTTAAETGIVQLVKDTSEKNGLEHEKRNFSMFPTFTWFSPYHRSSMSML